MEMTVWIHFKLIGFKVDGGCSYCEEVWSRFCFIIQVCLCRQQLYWMTYLLVETKKKRKGFRERFLSNLTRWSGQNLQPYLNWNPRIFYIPLFPWHTQGLWGYKSPRRCWCNYSQVPVYVLCMDYVHIETKLSTHSNSSLTLLSFLNVKTVLKFSLTSNSPF